MIGQTGSDHLQIQVSPGQGCELEALRGAGEGPEDVDEILCKYSFTERYTGYPPAG